MAIRNTARNLTLAATALLAGLALAPVVQASTMGTMHGGQMGQTMGTKGKGKEMMHGEKCTGAQSKKMGAMHSSGSMHRKGAMHKMDSMKMKSHAGMDSMAAKASMDSMHHDNGM